MDAKFYLDYIVRTIHSTVAATVDDAGDPVTCAIDMMDCDDDSLYFLTARGKRFYDRLVKRGKIAFTAMKGEDTLRSVAVSVRGRVREIGPERLPDLFEKNPYMKTIYPSDASRSALTVFQIYEGVGEWFDLSKQPIERASFAFGGAAARREGFFVQPDACIGCESCVSVCPQRCIQVENGKAVIRQEHCLHCGRCMDACPAGAVAKIG